MHPSLTGTIVHRKITQILKDCAEGDSGVVKWAFIGDDLKQAVKWYGTVVEVIHC
jgi:hypothetical protein